MLVPNMRSVNRPASTAVEAARAATQSTSTAHATRTLHQCLLQPKMADGLLCTEDATAEDVIDKTLVKTCESGDQCATVDTRTGAGADTLQFPYSNAGILQELCPSDNSASSPFKLDIVAVPVPEEIMQPCSPNTEEDCRKKRCVDRYDSSESSDSGVAVLSCTDCSGSSTASSDITDPGSPYSTASNHSDQDSNNSNPTLPSTIAPNTTATNNKPAQQMPPIMQQTLQSSAHHPPWHWAEDSSPPLKRPPNQLVVNSAPLAKQANVCINNNNKITSSESLLKTIVANSKAKMQQGKITEYFKSHHKAKEFRTTREKKQLLTRSVPPPGKVAIEKLTKPRKSPTVTTPRKILPAPSKQPPNNLTNITNLAQQFPTQTMTLTTLTFQQQQQMQFIPQFANQYVHHQGLSSGYIKINVPIVKLNAIGPMASLDTGSPTVLSAPASRGMATSQVKNGHAQIGLDLTNSCLNASGGIGVQPGQQNSGLSLTGGTIAPNAFSTTNNGNIGSSNKRKSSSSLLSSSNSPATETISSSSSTTTPLLSTLSYTPSLASNSNNNNNNNNNVEVTTTITTASTTQQPSISVTSVSDTSSKTSTSLKTLNTSSLIPSPSSSATLVSTPPTSISNIKEVSITSVPSTNKSSTPININNTSPVVVLQNQATIEYKPTKTPQDNALKSSETIKLNKTVISKTKQIVKEDIQLNKIPEKSVPIAESTSTLLKTSSKLEDHHNQSARSSPVDSEDSGISSLSTLSCITLSPEPISPCQKSPILSVPKTIRFPAAAGTVLCATVSSTASQLLSSKGVLLKKRKLCASGASGVLDKDCRGSLGGVCTAEKRQLIGEAVAAGVACMWSDCLAQFEASGTLLEHLQIKHVISQATCEHYVCLWQGCKVHGRKSCSRSWLERHVLAHAGTKPFRCIVDGCGMRFNSQLTLQRHVNGHFNGDQNQNGTSKKSVENALKLYKRNGKKIRFRRQPWSARMFDFIDASIMEGLQYQLVKMTEKRTMGQFESNVGNTVALQTQVMGRRVATDGVRQLLVRYHPKDILPDEWINESDYSTTKTVTISTLNSSAKISLQESLFSSTDSQTTLRQSKKHRRKPTHLKST